MRRSATDYSDRPLFVGQRGPDDRTEEMVSQVFRQSCGGNSVGDSRTGLASLLKTSAGELDEVAQVAINIGGLLLAPSSV